jgi:hypothetical protein
VNGGGGASCVLIRDNKIRRPCVDGKSGLAGAGPGPGGMYLPVERGSEGAGAPVHVRQELAGAAEAEGVRVGAFRRLVAGVPEKERERRERGEREKEKGTAAAVGRSATGVYVSGTEGTCGCAWGGVRFGVWRGSRPFSIFSPPLLAHLS